MMGAKMLKLTTPLAAGAAMLAMTSLALATNTPCSGSKGGISRCSGQYFICNDGSTSQSKKNCQAVFHGGGDADDSGDKPEKK